MGDLVASFLYGRGILGVGLEVFGDRFGDGQQGCNFLLARGREGRTFFVEQAFARVPILSSRAVRPKALFCP
jgi:hypothetical protein